MTTAMSKPDRQQDDTSGRSLDARAKNIHPGEWIVNDDRPIATLLGSCVAVALFDPVLRCGGLNHFMLPIRTRLTDGEYDSLLRGDYAMEVLVNAMLGRGARKPRLLAKAFGGGNVVVGLRTSIGEGNVEFTRTWLEREGIALVASDFGGSWARKVVFDPRTGEAFCRRIGSSQPVTTQVALAEADYEKTLVKKPVEELPAIELF